MQNFKQLKLKYKKDDKHKICVTIKKFWRII